MSFAEIADRRLLSSVAKHLGQLAWDVSPDGYQRLPVPATADVEPLLKLLARRGLDPAITTVLLEKFATRPIERALIAYDIAAGSLLGTGDRELADRVHALVAPLRPLGATASVAIPRDQVSALIAAVTAAGDQPMPEGCEPLPSLAGAAAIGRDDAASLDATLDLARRLALAHLPSLALAFAQILWARLAVPAAIDRIIETALDYERFDSIPVMAEQDGLSIVRQTYFAARVALAQLDTATASTILADLGKHPDVAASTDPRLRVVATECAVLDDRPQDLATLDALSAIADADPTWRYAARVRDAVRIQGAPSDAAITAEQFITSFGNDLRLWAAAAYRDADRPALLALVSREIRFCSHDPDAWRGFATLLEDGTDVEVELQARAAAQLAAALA